MIGRTIGNYVVKSKIGQGGMGALYLAEHPRIHKQVAIKVLLPEFGSNPQVVARFFNEAKAANEIHNEHIIDIIDFGELPEDGASYITMEWLSGRSLKDALAEVGKLPLKRAIHIARGIGRALAAAHAHGIVHRDLKPDNIYLITRADDTDFVKVLDFGIAKLTQADAANEIKTQTGAIIGTPSFMSPEQCRGLAVDQRTDIYAVGVLLYEMLTGVLPFRAEGLGELLLMHMTQAPQPLRELEPTIPPVVERAVLRALEKEPANRYQTINELLVGLSEVQTGMHPALGDQPLRATVVAKRTATPTMDTLGVAAGQAVEPTLSGRARKPAMMVGGLGLVAAAAVAAFVFSQKHTPPPVPPPAPRPVAAAQAPAPTPAPAPIPAPAAPATVHVVIRATPPQAQLLLDGGKVGNPFDASFPRGDVRHELTVKASGHRTETQWITFEADRTVDIALQKGSGTHRAAAPAAPLPTAPPAVAVKPPETRPTEARAPEAKAPEAKPATVDGKPVYKGTKGKLITEFPE